MAGASSASSSTDDLDWKFVQSFGDDNSSDDDLVTAVEFDETGQYLAVGDKAGRICIFEGHAVTASPNSNKKPIIPLEYKFYTEFQSHEPEFDCLKSLEIEEKINMIKWGKKINNGLFLLACNDKTIKYWKVHEKKIKRPSKVVEPAMNLPASTPTYLSTDVSIPKLTHHQTITTATPKRVYSNAHGYHINCFPEDDHQLMTQAGFMTLRQVEAHFAAHDTLSVACPLEDGSMMFCPISPSALLVHEGTHAHVEMVSAKSASASAALSLAPTTNHRMWVSVAGKPFAMHTAGELTALAATAAPALATPLLAQFEANCPLGSTGSPAALPFLHSLSLTTVDQSLAFLQLYGMSLQFAVRCDSALILVLQSADQCRFLDSLLARLPLPLLSTSLAALAYKGQHGYCRYGLRSYAILAPAWIAALHADATCPDLASWVHPCSALELRCILHGISGGQPLQTGSIVAASLPFRDQLTLLCLRAGYTSTFSENAADETWSVHYSLDAELTRPSLDCSSELRVVHKTGRVWCVSVPTAEHRIIFRRVLRFGKDGCSVSEASRPVVVGNSISINSDGETFISADDLRINLWNLQISNETFNVVDVKPPNLEELTEVITSATFHPHHCSQLIYSSSRGSIRLADLRDSALCDQHAKLFEVEEDPSQKSFFSEIISSISDAQFIGHEGRYILSRDYLTLKVWDVQMENRPVAVIPIHEYLKVHLCDLYENDWSEKHTKKKHEEEDIFDKFESASSSDGSRYVTGSYNNHFVIHHVPSASNITVEALKDPPKRKPKPDPKLLMSAGAGGKLTPKKTDAAGANETTPDTPNVNLMDFGKKALHVSYHPSQHVIAIAGLNKLYIYQAINATQP